MNFKKLCISKTILFYAGLVILLLSYIPMLLLGTDSIVPYHDQLDGELITYIYQAKYLFSGEDIIPQFLNGAPKTALTPPAPLAVLLFCVFSPFHSYFILLVFGQAIAFIGTFLFTEKMTANRYAAFISGLLYAFLPFLPVYGLTQYGIPLLLYCFLILYQKDKPFIHYICAYIYIAIYTGMSSFVLLGYAWVCAGFLAGIYFCFTGELKSQRKLLSAFFMMLFLYIIENLSLLGQLLGIGTSYTSHKAEYSLTGTGFWESLRSYLLGNTSHATDHHVYILFLALGTLLLTLLCLRNLSLQARTLSKYLFFDLLLIFLICSIAALWDIPFIVSIREQMGSLKSFQFTRILWMTPALWYIALTLCLSIFWSEKVLLRWLQYTFSTIALAILCLNCVKGAYVKPCLQELLLPEYETISWSDYLALGVMDQVEDYLYQEEGLRKDQYQVASLGIDPSAALYHGFYCVDGYSNNYPLAYKHAFREVIAPELKKSDYLTTYYDDWGNRCYLFSSEIPGYYNIEKGSFWYNQLELDTAALQNLGCDYILSAAYIVNASDINLTLLREEAFETADSYYRIYIYKIGIQ